MLLENYDIDHQQPIPPILEFFQFARENELKVGLKEAQDAIQAAGLGLYTNQNRFKYTLRSICCGDIDDFKKFDNLFEIFWNNQGDHRKAKIITHGKLPEDDISQSSLLMMGTKHNQPEETLYEAHQITGASHQERLRETDFSKVKEIDAEIFEELALRLWSEMANRLKNKMRRLTRGKRIDFGRTIRSSISKGGWPYQLVFKDKKKEKKNFVLLLDVSGSMDKYSFFLLKFIYVIRKYFKRLEVFTFSTSLTRVTHILEKKKIDEALKEISEQVKSWSSGTRIGDCLEEFNSKYAKQVLSRSSIVLILSDGLDTGDINLLKRAVNDLNLKAKQLIWLNPLKGSTDYEPIQRGMSAALPFVDQFQSAHNLNSLLELEKILADA